MIKAIMILVIVAISAYLLYINGFLTIQAKRAVLYVGSPGGTKARFSACTGYLKRIVRFKDSAAYRIVLDSELTAGDISVEFLDLAKQPVLRLNGSTRNGIVNAEKRKRYYLVVRFQSAAGSYTLSWDKSTSL